MDKASKYARYSIFNFFSFSQKTPEQILVETQWTTVVVLVGVALFAHNPLPLFPAAVLLMGLYGYSSRRAALKCPPAMPDNLDGALPSTTSHENGTSVA